jgi:Rrf2 family nitric oxide-sensitive transcriptional repressor
VKLTAFADFGLRTLLLLAGSERPSWSTPELAARLQVSRDHLIKVVQRLAAGGYVQTMRGSGGGVSLSRDPAMIRLGEVLAWMEQEQALVECFRENAGDCCLLPVCQLRGRLAAAEAAFYAELDRSSVADCLSQPLRQFALGAAPPR